MNGITAPTKEFIFQEKHIEGYKDVGFKKYQKAQEIPVNWDKEVKKDQQLKQHQTGAKEEKLIKAIGDHYNYNVKAFIENYTTDIHYDGVWIDKKYDVKHMRYNDVSFRLSNPQYENLEAEILFYPEIKDYSVRVWTLLPSVFDDAPIKKGKEGRHDYRSVIVPKVNLELPKVVLN